MMRSTAIVLFTLFGICAPAFSQVRIGVGIGVPSVSIGINVPTYPALVPVPGYPVYYAPSVNANLFFYDGRYWTLADDHWYASSWYNGPWNIIAPEAVPLFVLRVPVRYYRRPPPYFRGWIGTAPPRWGDHWGPGWAGSRRGWDQWDRHAIPGRAPLPTYQRGYAGDRYPRAEQQQALRDQNYRYQSREGAPGNRAPQNRQAPEQRQGPGRERDHEH